MKFDLEKYIDEILALMVVLAFIFANIAGLEMPMEALMLVLFFYFGEKIAPKLK